MKDYKTVIATRYEIEKNQNELSQSLYAMINPIGFHHQIQLSKLIYSILNFLKTQYFDINTATILELGCGSGKITRIFAEFLQNASQVTGLDLAKNRIKLAKELNPKIEYVVEDMTQLNFKGRFWSLIVAFDAFMHLSKEEDIIQTLMKIHQHLSNRSYFIWFDPYAKDHFQSPMDVDGWGYNRKQMCQMAGKAGFELCFAKSLYKLIFGKYHTLYLVKKYPFSLISFIEKLVPGPPGNICLVFRKKEG